MIIVHGRVGRRRALSGEAVAIALPLIATALGLASLVAMPTMDLARLEAFS